MILALSFNSFKFTTNNYGYTAMRIKIKNTTIFGQVLEVQTKPNGEQFYKYLDEETGFVKTVPFKKAVKTYEKERWGA